MSVRVTRHRGISAARPTAWRYWAAVPLALVTVWGCHHPPRRGLDRREGDVLTFRDGSSYRLRHVELADAGRVAEQRVAAHLDGFLEAAAGRGVIRRSSRGAEHLLLVEPVDCDLFTGGTACPRNVDVEELLVVTGYARASPAAGERLVRAQRIARRLQLGVWYAEPTTLPPVWILGLGTEFVTYGVHGVAYNVEMLLPCIDEPMARGCAEYLS